MPEPLATWQFQPLLNSRKKPEDFPVAVSMWEYYCTILKFPCTSAAGVVAESEGSYFKKKKKRFAITPLENSFNSEILKRLKSSRKGKE